MIHGTFPQNHFPLVDRPCHTKHHRSVSSEIEGRGSIHWEGDPGGGRVTGICGKMAMTVQADEMQWYRFRKASSDLVVRIPSVEPTPRSINSDSRIRPDMHSGWNDSSFRSGMMFFYRSQGYRLYPSGVHHHPRLQRGAHHPFDPGQGA
jgi:hypothetical protein